MKRIVVTIARQYGSGGREIGERVAELLGIPKYDKEFVTLAASKDETVCAEALEKVETSGAKLLGTVLTDMKVNTGNYGRYGRYGRYERRRYYQRYDYE